MHRFSLLETSLKVPDLKVSLATLCTFFVLVMRLGFPHTCPTAEPCVYHVIIPQWRGYGVYANMPNTGLCAGTNLNTNRLKHLMLCVCIWKGQYFIFYFKVGFHSEEDYTGDCLSILIFFFILYSLFIINENIYVINNFW